MSFYKVQSVSWYGDDYPIQKEHAKRMGGYNDVPPNLRQLTVAELIQSRGSELVCRPEFIEFRQCNNNFPGIPGFVSVYLHYDSSKRKGILILPRQDVEEIHYYSFAWDYVHPCPLKEDTGWKGFRGGRCIVDYKRYLTFERDLNSAEMDDVKYWVSKGHPGNYNPSIRPTDTLGKYELSCTHDSSD